MNFIKMQGLSVLPLPALLRKNGVRSGQGDTGYIASMVLEDGAPVVRRVFCYHRATGQLSGSTWSNENGEYRIDGLVAGVLYFLTSLDEEDDLYQFNAVSQDLIAAKPLDL